MSTRAARLAGLLLSLLVTVVIIVMSLDRNGHIPQFGGAPNADKIGHFLAYAALGFSLGLWRYRRPDSPLLPLLLAALLGSGMEVLQPYFGRCRELGDVLADILGAVLGLLFLRLCVMVCRKLSLLD